MKRYTDYRLMLEQQKDIDAVVVATPDHMHAPIAMAALDLGKHVYVQKPLCWSVDEARKLSRKARQTPKAVTQMGNQGHSWDDGRQGRGVGAVRRDRRRDAKCTSGPTVRCRTGRRAFRARSRGASPSNMRWNMNGVMARLANAMGIYSVPDELSWDLFLGRAPAVRVSPGLSPVQLARLGRLGRRRARRHGRAPDRLSRTGRSISATRRSIETVSTPFDGDVLPDRHARRTTSSRRAAPSRRSSSRGTTAGCFRRRRRSSPTAKSSTARAA